MFVAALPLGWRLSVYLLAGIGAGIANGIAGGGTFVTFPDAARDRRVGVDRERHDDGRRRAELPRRHTRLSIPTRGSPRPDPFAGPVVPAGARRLGCALLLLGSPHLFALVVPWLIGSGTLLFALAPLITKRLAHVDHAHRARRWGLYVGVFVVAIYGGYFGAGMGILLLAVMALSLPFEIQELQGLRSVLSLIINVLAALIFVLRGHLIVDAVYMFLIGTLIGGWLGAMLILRLSPNVVRVVIIVVGLVTTVRLAITA
jgi:uncharacterized protein